jgi:hypothetical protein
MAVLITLLFFVVVIGGPLWFFVTVTRKTRTRALRQDLATKAKWEDEQRRKQERGQ